MTLYHATLSISIYSYGLQVNLSLCQQYLYADKRHQQHKHGCSVPVDLRLDYCFHHFWAYLFASWFATLGEHGGQSVILRTSTLNYGWRSGHPSMGFHTAIPSAQQNIVKPPLLPRSYPPSHPRWCTPLPYICGIFRHFTTHLDVFRLFCHILRYIISDWIKLVQIYVMGMMSKWLL